ncbi:MAG: palindromic element RPE4 domain-containing protein [Rickettsia endosymbiont of Graphium doson]|nr:palindromic element RPE4 domain-containing protein [Rickettsia endosymbiont of Graphium doson]
MTTGSSNIKHTYKKLDLSQFFLDPVVKPRGDIEGAFRSTQAMPPRDDNGIIKKT